jgi:hypothetical protein
MQASTRARNKAMQGRNFPERLRLGTFQRPTSSRASLARSGPLTAGLSAKRTGLEALDGAGRCSCRSRRPGSLWGFLRLSLRPAGARPCLPLPVALSGVAPGSPAL